jgi:hypothetical protein
MYRIVSKNDEDGEGMVPPVLGRRDSKPRKLYSRPLLRP